MWECYLSFLQPVQGSDFFFKDIVVFVVVLEFGLLAAPLANFADAFSCKQNVININIPYVYCCIFTFEQYNDSSLIRKMSLDLTLQV